jgi:hypothetical protein
MSLLENKLKGFYLTLLPPKALKKGLSLFAKIVVEEAKKGKINASLREEGGTPQPNPLISKEKYVIFNLY